MRTHVDVEVRGIASRELYLQRLHRVVARGALRTIGRPAQPALFGHMRTVGHATGKACGAVRLRCGGLLVHVHGNATQWLLVRGSRHRIGLGRGPRSVLLPACLQCNWQRRAVQRGHLGGARCLATLGNQLDLHGLHRKRARRGAGDLAVLGPTHPANLGHVRAIMHVIVLRQLAGDVEAHGLHCQPFARSAGKRAVGPLSHPAHLGHMRLVRQALRGEGGGECLQSLALPSVHVAVS